MNRSNARRRAGMAQMVEMVFLTGLILFILVLLYIFASISVRVQHTSVMTRYEVWRSADQAPGPRQTSFRLHNPQLDSAFYSGSADRVRGFHVDGGDDDGGDFRIEDDVTEGNSSYFPEEPYNQMLSASSQMSQDAGALADAYVYRPDGEFRYSRGRQKVFGAGFEWTARYWTSIQNLWPDRSKSEAERWEENPGNKYMKRHFMRIGTDWPYTNRWQASHGHYRGGGADVQHLRSLRDAFYLEFDQTFDAIDGDTRFEYDGSPSQTPGDNLAGLVRKLYLRAPRYRGPDLGVDED
ncbi:MAG: hypothetical protein R3236_03020 [Phycisphaeraceae bacterium]|nr:hypothetical protein [Phycisphaeraceae bacterium]